MTATSTLRRAATLAALLLPFTTLQAQTKVAYGASVASDYLFRGLTVTNRTVFQPDVSVSAGAFTFGAWGNIEPQHTATPNDLSQTGGVRSGLSEVDLFAEAAQDFGAAHVTVGGMHYGFDHHNATVSDAYNTTEVYGKIAFASAPLAPEVHAFWDVQTIHGVYVEAQVAQSVRAVTFAVLAGYAAGQERQGESDSFFAYAKRGLTHVDASAATTFSLGRLSIAPSVHAQYAPSGQNTRVIGALESRQDRATRIWFGVRVGSDATVGGR